MGSIAALAATERDDAGEDTALVRAARQDSDAFIHLYQRYRNRVYAYLLSRTASPEDAADLTQHVFVRAFDGFAGYRGSGETFAAWLFRIARNAAIDYHRRLRATVTWDAVPRAWEPVAETDPETAVLHREALERLRGLLEALPADKRELLALRFGAGLTAAQIAAVVGKSKAATAKQITRTLQTLKEQYDAPPG